MPVVIAARRSVPFAGGSATSLKPVGMTITGMPTKLPAQIHSQSVALPTNASTFCFFISSISSLASFPRARCACNSNNLFNNLRAMHPHTAISLAPGHFIVSIHENKVENIEAQVLLLSKMIYMLSRFTFLLLLSGMIYMLSFHS